MSYFRRVELNNRPKKFFDNANMTKQYLFTQTSTGTGTGGGGGSTSTAVGEEFIYYLEFDFETNINVSFDFVASQRDAITALGFNTDLLKISTSFAYEIIDGEITGLKIFDATAVTVSNNLSGDDDRFETVNNSILEFKERVNNNELSISFTDRYGNSNIAQARLSLNTDKYHLNVYRFNTLYEFKNDTENVFALISANSATARDTSSSTINNGAKVYVQNRNGEFLICDMTRGELVIDTDVLLSSTTGLTATIFAGTQTNLALETVTGKGRNGIISITAADTTAITSITVTSSGSDYAVGDQVKIPASAIAGRTTDLEFTLRSENIARASTGKLTGFRDGIIKWSTETQYRLLFEVHAYNNEDMSDTNIIESTRPIPNDYGFKLEILPPTISNVFNGLSSFVDDYTFEDDGDYTLVDNDIQGFNISMFYEEDLGISAPTNDPAIDDIQYDIDECFLTFDRTKPHLYSFTYGNDENLSKKFWDGTETT